MIEYIDKRPDVCGGKAVIESLFRAGVPGAGWAISKVAISDLVPAFKIGLAACGVMMGSAPRAGGQPEYIDWASMTDFVNTILTEPASRE